MRCDQRHDSQSLRDQKKRRATGKANSPLAGPELLEAVRPSEDLAISIFIGRNHNTAMMHTRIHFRRKTFGWDNARPENSRVAKQKPADDQQDSDFSTVVSCWQDWARTRRRRGND